MGKLHSIYALSPSDFFLEQNCHINHGIPAYILSFKSLTYMKSHTSPLLSTLINAKSVLMYCNIYYVMCNLKNVHLIHKIHDNFQSSCGPRINFSTLSFWKNRDMYMPNQYDDVITHSRVCIFCSKSKAQTRSTYTDCNYLGSKVHSKNVNSQNLLLQ